MKQSVKNETVVVSVRGLRRQKIWGLVVLVGLFVCGWMVGVAINNDFMKKNSVEHLEAQQATQGVSIRQDENFANLSTCEKIEKILLPTLNSENNLDYDRHLGNVSTYKKLAQYGCDENRAGFAQKADSELEVARALGATDADVQYATERVYASAESPCEVIERVLSGQLRCLEHDEFCHYNKYLANADVYSTMAEKGCPENSEKYKELALNQLQIASALDTKNYMAESSNEAETVVDIYKKLQMQQEAYKYINKMKQLVDPATDFIIKLEKIINEE